MPSSPRTPTHSRHTSSLSFTTPGYDGTPRRNSKASMFSPSTPHRQSFNPSETNGMDVFSSGGRGPSDGLGNLADELADAWDDDEADDEEPDMNFQEVKLEGETTRDSGVDVTSSPVLGAVKPVGLSPPEGQRGHRRKTSDYDGSDYGDDSDMESLGIPPALIARMDMVESLARRGLENNGTERDGVVLRLVEALKDLGQQSGVEGGASRLITTNSALSTHLLHQTRQLQSLAHPLFSPLSLPPDEEFINELLPLLLALGNSMPRPTTDAFNALSQLHGSTAELISNLNYLTDNLHMSRQNTTAAARRLKTVKDLVAEMRKDEDEREEGERWLSQGNWSERLARRECADVCGDVVNGFEEVCNGWRARLVAQAEAVA